MRLKNQLSIAKYYNAYNNVQMAKGVNQNSLPTDILVQINILHSHTVGKNNSWTTSAPKYLCI